MTSPPDASVVANVDESLESDTQNVVIVTGAAAGFVLLLTTAAVCRQKHRRKLRQELQEKDSVASVFSSSSYSYQPSLQSLNSYSYQPSLQSLDYYGQY